MPAAAAVPPSSIGGIAQNTLITERWPIWQIAKREHEQIDVALERDGQEQADRGRDRTGGDVELALAGAIAVAADQHHRDERGDERDAR